MTHTPPLNKWGKLTQNNTDTYQHTINGLLHKRADHWNEAERLRDRMAEIKNDVLAIDRALGVLGYTGELDSIMPRQKVVRLFGQGELLMACLHELRHADGPLTSRQIARNVIEIRDEDPNDRKYLSDMTRRISKCLRQERAAGTVRAKQHIGRSLIWEIAQKG